MDFCGHSVPSPLLNAVLFAVITLSWQFPNPNTNHNLCPTFCLGRYQDLLLSKETIDFTLTFVSIYFFRPPHPPSISADGRMSERGRTSCRQRTEPAHSTHTSAWTHTCFPNQHGCHTPFLHGETTLGSGCCRSPGSSPTKALQHRLEDGTECVQKMPFSPSGCRPWGKQYPQLCRDCVWVR